MMTLGSRVLCSWTLAQDLLSIGATGELALPNRDVRAVVERVLETAQVLVTFDDVQSMLLWRRAFTLAKRRASSRVGALLVSGIGVVGVVGAPGPASAQERKTERVAEARAQAPSGVASSAEPKRSPLEEAKALFQDGVVAYNMSNYEEALAKFSEAFALSMRFEDEEQRVKVLHALHFNLARAHAKTYAIDQDPRHLRTAVDLLGKYLSVESNTGDRGEAELLVTKAQAELERVGSLKQRPRRSRGRSRVEGEDVQSTSSYGRGLTIAGIAALGMAGVGLAVMSAGFLMTKAARDDLGSLTTDVAAVDARGNTANILATTGLVSAVAFGTAGATLFVIGRRRQRTDGSQARLSLAPWLERGRSGGVVVGGSF